MIVANCTCRSGLMMLAASVSLTGISTTARADANRHLKPATSSAASADATDQNALEPVVVTAQRRSQNPQTVPVSISAVTGRMAKDMGIKSSQNISIAAPAVTFTQTSSGANVTIRGVGGSGSSVDEAGNAVYIDGVYQAAGPGLIFVMNDIERIEVDKGPQGTLFGRNSTGGVIQITTRAPGPTPTADVSLGYGNYDTTEAKAYLDGPLANGVTANLSIYGSDQRDGWGADTTTGKSAYEGKSLGARGKLRWELGADTKATLVYSYTETTPPGSQGGNILAGETTKGFGGVSGLPAAAFYDTTANGLSGEYYLQNQVALTAQHEAGWARLVDIASYSKTDLTYHADADFGPAAIAQVDIFNPVTSVTEELQALSPASSLIKWSGGFFYLYNKLSLDPFLTSGAALAATSAVPYVDDSSTTNSYAIYGQATMPLMWKTHLTLGARYSLDDRRLVGATRITGGITADYSRTDTDRTPTWHVSLDRQLTADVLTYISYNRGYHSGLYNLTALTAPPVKPEYVDAYETGFKSELFNDRARVNMAGFYYDFKDIQVRTTTPTGATVLLNAASATIYGLDADLSSSPIQNVTLQASASYLHGIYDKFDNAPFFAAAPAGLMPILPPQSAKGKELPNSPRWAASLAANYLIPARVGNFNLSWTVYYNGGYYFDPQDRVLQGAYSLLNASVSWTSPAGSFGVRAWGENIGATKYINFATSSGSGDEYFPGDPRTYGVTFSYHY